MDTDTDTAMIELMWIPDSSLIIVRRRGRGRGCGRAGLCICQLPQHGSHRSNQNHLNYSFLNSYNVIANFKSIWRAFLFCCQSIPIFFGFSLSLHRIEVACLLMCPRWVQMRSPSSSARSTKFDIQFQVRDTYDKAYVRTFPFHTEQKESERERSCGKEKAYVCNKFRPKPKYSFRSVGSLKTSRWRGCLDANNWDRPEDETNWKKSSACLRKALGWARDENGEDN